MINNPFAIIYHLHQTIFLLCNCNFMKARDFERYKNSHLKIFSIGFIMISSI